MALNEKLHIIPLGGLGEIGKNITVFQCGSDIIVVDCGLKFPEDELLGVDIVIPDITFLKENSERIRGIILTHGHEDHIGALPYVLRDLNVPVYGTRLTLGLLQQKLLEHEVLPVDMRCVRAGDTLRLGKFTVEFFRVSHSIADAVGLAITTSVGTVVHSGDFKIDHTPVDGVVMDFHRLAELGNKGVLLLLSDSTNAEKPGYTLSERVVGNTFDNAFRQARGRIIIATFASNIHRLQQAFTTASKYGRQVAVVGRSMENVVRISEELGYLKIPPGTLLEVEEINNVPRERLVILTTGSQGEPMSALTRMAMGDHRWVEVVAGDTVVISAIPIPGNEKLVSRTIDLLFKLGAEVIYEAAAGIHVSGHASQEELKMMLNLVRPKFFLPIHGEYRHLIKHARLAQCVGIPEENIFVLENGQVLELTSNSACISGRVAAGRVLVDGLGVGDVGNIVLRDRKQLSEEGIIIVVVTINKETGAVLAGPDIVSRGFVYVRESEPLIEEARERVRYALEKGEEQQITEWSIIKNNIREVLSKFLYERTKRRPMIIPIVMEV